MLEKKKFPIQIFIILEKVNLNFWTNKLNSSNLFFLYFAKSWMIPFINILKNEVFLNNSTLIEMSYIDYNNYFLKNFNFLKFKGMLYVNFYIYQLKLKLIVFFLNNQKIQNFPSIDKLYLNADWLERETSEMYNVIFNNKNDTRNLLLEYSKKEAVMSKEYQIEGFNDIYYSFFENQVILKKNFLVEL